MEKYCRAVQATTNNMRMRIERWVPKATDTHSEYVIFIAFPLQQCSHKRASMLPYTYIGCLVIHKIESFINTNSAKEK